MYKVERTAESITVRNGQGAAVFIAPPDSLIAYRSNSFDDPNSIVISKVKDLTDENLLRALINAIEIKDFAH